MRGLFFFSSFLDKTRRLVWYQPEPQKEKREKRRGDQNFLANESVNHHHEVGIVYKAVSLLSELCVQPLPWLGAHLTKRTSSFCRWRQRHTLSTWSRAVVGWKQPFADVCDYRRRSHIYQVFVIYVKDYVYYYDYCDEIRLWSKQYFLYSCDMVTPPQQKTKINTKTIFNQ